MERSRLLFVCLGNICRSPAAEGVFLHQLQQRGLEQSFRVDSAGTGSWHTGQPADARMRAAAAGRGIHLPSRARQIVAADLDGFDHILTMDDDNLMAVQAMGRGRETKAQIRPITQHCRRQRVREVPDPYYGGTEGFERVLDLLEDACTGLLEDLLASHNS
ncbi:low molecular weight phosphotyrosine protein phosphatase [Synechococcus sp. CS-1329]|uniref:low molecular weight protein-tyrosine-phosphatase n=1 Tax=Synechococcus sp. CS-1329 TaxID=2847975 RepID=UPI00223B6B70|nr:low molecular weight protein-tyrosine-phosphatase [Synechococcus sp. CS-1329]MCT0219331.1 low molecular weight phosphotyrosine protein phosphatase [Synechococcus sp. CS-1329]